MLQLENYMQSTDKSSQQQRRPAAYHQALNQAETDISNVTDLSGKSDPAADLYEGENGRFEGGN